MWWRHCVSDGRPRNTLNGSIRYNEKTLNMCPSYSQSLKCQQCTLKTQSTCAKRVFSSPNGKILRRNAMIARMNATLSSRVSVSVTSRHRCHRIETTSRIELDFGTEASFHLYPTPCCEEFWVSPKIRVLPSGTLSRTLDLENFATVSRSRCQQNSATVELVDDTYIRQSTSRVM